MDCIYCSKTYQSKSSLHHHQKTNKTCLNIQEKSGIEISEHMLSCSFCNKKVSSKFRLENHLLSCKKKKELDNNSKRVEQTKEIQEKLQEQFEDELEKISFELRNQKEEFEYELRIKDEKIKTLEAQIKKQQPIKITNKIDTVNNTNTINNITIFEVMTPDRVKEYFKKNYNLDTLLGGQRELARFVYDEFIQKENAVYQCTDRSRNKFIMFENGKMVEDTNCDSIVGLTSHGLPQVKQVYEDALFSTIPENITENDIQDNYLSITRIDQDRSVFKNELSKIVTSSTSEKPLHLDLIENVKRQCSYMREHILPLEKTETSESLEYYEPIRRPDVCGVSRGRLMIYRERYRKDKTIKGPSSIMKQIENGNKLIEEEYLSYLRSFE